MASLSGKKILLVDDTENNLIILTQALEKFGLEILTATNGNLALVLAKNHKPDLILLDIMMPDISGFEVCQRLKGDPATGDIPIIFITAKNGQEDIEKGYQMGCEEYITKPIQIDQVCARVRTQLLSKNGSSDQVDSIDISNMNVLVVDDNPDNIGLIKQTLEPANLGFSMAPNGLVAVELAQKTLPDLILLDVMMPEMSGFHACQELKGNASTRSIPVIFLTAKREPDDIQKGYDLGCVDYIPKPFVIQELLSRVVSHLRLRKRYLEKEKWIQQLEQIKSDLEKQVLQKTTAACEAKDEAERANREKTEYIIKMTHELRTPINAILGFSQLLNQNTDAPLTGFQKESIQHIQTAGRHLVSLIVEVLDLEKLEHGTITLSCQKINLLDLTRENVIPMVSGMAVEKKITLNNNFEQHPKLVLNCDPLRMTQILINLVTNAIKYNHPGGTVTLDFVKTKKRKGRITIADTGPGIPQDMLETIFKPFTRLETNDLNVEGLGVGLTITLKFVQLMGAKLLVDSQIGKGSVFSIEFPLNLQP